MVRRLISNGRLHPDYLADQVDVLGRELISSRKIAWRWRVSPAMRGRYGRSLANLACRRLSNPAH